MSLSDHSRLHVKQIMTTAEATRRGIKGLRSKLTDENVLEIRMLLAAKIIQEIIANAYGVNVSVISGISSGRRRCHV